MDRHGSKRDAATPAFDLYESVNKKCRVLFGHQRYAFVLQPLHHRAVQDAPVRCLPQAAPRRLIR